MRNRSNAVPAHPVSGRLGRLVALVLVCLLCVAAQAVAQSDPLPSWNDGPAKKAILAFVQATTDTAGPDYVPPEARIATFDQDGTTWVEQPLYTQIVFALDQVRALLRQKPQLASVEPFKTVQSGDVEALAKLSDPDMGKLLAAAFTGMTVEAYADTVKAWLETARDPRWKRPYTELVYQPMLEVMQLLRAHGYKVYFVTGGDQGFVRVFAQQVYGVPPEQVVGYAWKTRYDDDGAGRATLTREPAVLIATDFAGKPEGIQLMIGRRPRIAFGNSDGDRQMLEYTQSGDGARLSLLVRHDDAGREYAYGPDSKIGTFSDALMAEARQKGWVVISMKDDWKRVFSWEP
jgi:phosphoglycolate phosphatase-like HAD superfamily hydrolase